MERLSRAGASLKPASLGSWLELRPDGINAGWYFPADLPLDRALGELDNRDHRAALLAWAGSHGITTCMSLGRAMGAGNPYTELTLPLPGADVVAQVQAGMAALAALRAAPPPDDALAALMNLEHTGLALTLGLTARGVIKAGLQAAQPVLTLMIDLCRLAGVDAVEPLAAFQGTLGVDGPVAVEAQTRASGYMAELHYLLATP